MGKIASALLVLLLACVIYPTFAEREILQSDAAETLAREEKNEEDSGSKGTCYAPSESLLFPPDAKSWVTLDGEGYAIFFCENDTVSTHSELYLTLTDESGLYTGCFYYDPNNGVSTYRIINQYTGELRVIETLSKVVYRELSPNSIVDLSRRKVISDTAYPPTQFVVRYDTVSNGTDPPPNTPCGVDDYKIPVTLKFDMVDCVTDEPLTSKTVVPTIVYGSAPVEDCGVNGPVGPVYLGTTPSPPPPIVTANSSLAEILGIPSAAPPPVVVAPPPAPAAEAPTPKEEAAPEKPTIIIAAANAPTKSPSSSSVASVLSTFAAAIVLVIMM